MVHWGIPEFVNNVVFILGDEENKSALEALEAEMVDTEVDDDDNG